MTDASERRAKLELVQLRGTALLIAVSWLGIVLSPRWSIHSLWKTSYKFGVVLAVLVGVLATAAYIRWLFTYSKVDQSMWVEDSYRRIRDMANVGMLVFLAAQMLL